MSLFKQKSDLPDVDSYCRKKKTWKLFPLLIHENSIIVEKAIKALGDIISDDDAYQERKKIMTVSNYDTWISLFESENLIKYKEIIEPIVQTLRNEQSTLQENKEDIVIEALDARIGMSKLQKNTKQKLCEIIEDGESIEFGQQFNLGLWVKVNEGILLTNKRIMVNSPLLFGQKT